MIGFCDLTMKITLILAILIFMSFFKNKLNNPGPDVDQALEIKSS